MTNKKQYKLLKKSQSYTYNKVQEYVDVEWDADMFTGEYKYGDGVILVGRPFIDKLHIQYDMEDFKLSPKQKEKLVERVKYNLENLCNQNGFIERLYFPSYSQNVNDLGEGNVYQLARGYDYPIAIQLNAYSRPLIIQFAPKNKKKKFMNMEWNVSHFSSDDMQLLRKVFKAIFENDDFEINLDTIFAVKERIKEVHVACDMYGVDVINLIGGYKDFSAKKHLYFSSEGKLQTRYFFNKNNLEENLYAYDKMDEYQDNNSQKDEDSDNDCSDKVDNSFITEVRHSQVAVLRIEYRVKRTKHSVNRLPFLKNHLEKFLFQALDYSKVDKKKTKQMLFIRCAGLEGLENALDCYPPKEKYTQKKFYNDLLIDIWDANGIWKNGWHDSLLESGLVTHIDQPKKKGKKKKSKKA